MRRRREMLRSLLGSRPSRRDAETATPRPIMRDGRHQRDLDGQGFVRIDLLDEQTVGDLRSCFEQLSHDMALGTTFADGFHTTMYDARSTYRAAVFESITEVVEPAAALVFDRCRIGVANFAVKVAGGASVPLHRDWSFVDEERHRSVGMWIALDDIAVDGGVLGVVDGSHLTADLVRPVNDRVYEPLEASSGALEVRPMTAGQAIVYDSRAVHFSTPNSTAAPRRAAACIVAPVEACLVHDWYDEESRLRRFEVSSDFFLDYEIGRDPSGSRGVLSSALHTCTSDALPR